MSAFVKQLSDARASSAIRKICGVCSDGDQYRDYINEATELAMNRGAWQGTELLMRLCGTGCHAVFPRYVGTVHGLRSCCNRDIEIKNHWWAILGPGVLGQGWGGDFGGGWWGGYGARADAIDINNVPIFNQVSGNTGKLIRWHTVNAQDYGKKLTLYGKKYGGQPLQQLVSSVTENGLTLTASAFSQTTDLVTKIDSVVLEPTVGMSYLYEYDTATTKLRMLASYEPGETNPSYRQMKLPRMGYGQVDENGVCNWRVEALVKLNFIPVVSDNDFLLISNFNALAMAIQSIKAREANDLALSEAMFAAALKELNFELRNKSPDQQLSVRVNVMGSGRVLTSPI